jgi:hypothetical protein
VAETSGPFDGTALAEADWELMLQTLVDGVIGSPGAAALAATASGTRGVNLGAGTALALGHWYRADATVSLSSSANTSGSSRIDRAVLRLDRSANTVTARVLTGTAGSGLPPALSNTSTVSDRPLWRWTVASGATTVSGLTDERQWAPVNVGACTSTNRPLSPGLGEIRLETDTGHWIGWTAGGWVVLHADTGWSNCTVNATNFSQGVIPPGGPHPQRMGELDRVGVEEGGRHRPQHDRGQNRRYPVYGHPGPRPFRHRLPGRRDSATRPRLPGRWRPRIPTVADQQRERTVRQLAVHGLVARGMKGI